MSSKIKQSVAKNFFDTLTKCRDNKKYEDVLANLSIKRSEDKSRVSWVLKLDENSPIDADLLKSFKNKVTNENDVCDILHRKQIDSDFLEVQVSAKNFIRDILNSNPANLNFTPMRKKVIVEFSSPNIAKPFHVGHLRSTLIGNYLANLKKKLGMDVIKMNFLGDWGTQFGLIEVGVEKQKYSMEKLEENPISLLFEAYVVGNREAEKDNITYNMAKKIFIDLENEEEEIIKKWNMYNKWTMKELIYTYNRLGVTFDEYCYESAYKRKHGNEILKKLDEAGVLSVDHKGRKVAKVKNQEIPLIKSDDTTLYMFRDLLAFLDRRSRHNFDEMYYVVENGQSSHFTSLFALCKQLGIDESVKIEHVKFGRISGMSTRKGKVIFLKDVLDEAMEIAYEKQKASATTKTSLETKEVADVIGVSAVIVNDLKHKWRHNYDVSWEAMLQSNGHTGKALQYCHCRLTNLIENSKFSPATDCDPEAFQEPEALNLISKIAGYENIILKSNAEMESSFLVSYLFEIMKASSVAFRALNVRNSEELVGSQRLLLFKKSREVLADGMKLLGLKPLKQM